MTGARDLYDQARARALARAGDPQGTVGGGQAALDAAAALAARCVCGDPCIVHEIAESGRARGTRTWCTMMTAAGPCGCPKFQPEGES
jgi:hypothetical protein